MGSIQTIQAIGILAVFIISVILMMTKKVPTILALPIMGVVFALIAGVPFMSSNGETYTIAKNVLEAGAMKMSTAIAGLIFGAWFGQILSKVGVTKSIIKKAAELAGDKPLGIAITFFVAASVIFSASSGLGMVILVGTIIIPIMLTAGLSPLVSAMVLLLANAVGVTFNVSNWGVYTDVVKLPVNTVAAYTLIPAIPLIVVSLAMIVFYTKKGGRSKRAWAMPIKNEVINNDNKNVRAIAMISPIIPVVLVFAFKLTIVPSIFIGAAIAILLATPKRPIHVLSSALIDGIQDVAGAMGLMIGIGILLNSVMAPQVATIIEPLIKAIIPTSPIAYILIFTVLAPLAIYRGPLNVWGLGSGIAALMISAGMNPIAAMLALRIDSNLQAVCDPTNSHNVWAADFTKTDINEILKKTIGWLLVAVLISMIVASFVVFK